jgi:hypothetical protein
VAGDTTQHPAGVGQKTFTFLERLERASARTNLANICSHLHHHDEAIQQTRIAVSLHRANWSGTGVAHSRANTSRSYSELGRHTEAVALPRRRSRLPRVARIRKS